MSVGSGHWFDTFLTRSLVTVGCAGLYLQGQARVHLKYNATTGMWEKQPWMLERLEAGLMGYAGRRTKRLVSCSVCPCVFFRAN